MIQFHTTKSFSYFFFLDLSQKASPHCSFRLQLRLRFPPLPPRSSVASVRPRLSSSASVSSRCPRALPIHPIHWAAARLAGFGLAAPYEDSYCVVIIKKPLELGVQKITHGLLVTSRNITDIFQTLLFIPNKNGFRMFSLH